MLYRLLVLWTCYPRGTAAILVMGALGRISVRAPRRPLRKVSAVRSHHGPPRIGDPLPIRGNCFPLGRSPCRVSPYEIGRPNLERGLLIDIRSAGWLTRKGAAHVPRAGLHHRALLCRVRPHGSRSGDALAATLGREPLAMHYDRYGRTLYPMRRARRVQRGRLRRGRRTPRVLARGTTGGRDEKR